MLENTEEWIDIESYEGLYQVSNCGRVRSLPRTTTKGKILKLSCSGSGYPIVVLSKDGQTSTKNVHRIVVETFIGSVPQGMCVNHKDGNKENNSIDNLEITTYSENVHHAILNGLSDYAYWKGICGEDHPNSNKYIVTKPNGDSFKITGISNFCKNNGLTSSAMILVAQGKRKHHKGWKCSYCSE